MNTTDAAIAEWLRVEALRRKRRRLYFLLGDYLLRVALRDGKK